MKTENRSFTHKRKTYHGTIVWPDDPADVKRHRRKIDDMRLDPRGPRVRAHVNPDQLVSRGKQRDAKVGTDLAGRPGDQDAHRNDRVSRCSVWGDVGAIET